MSSVRNSWGKVLIILAGGLALVLVESLTHPNAGPLPKIQKTMVAVSSQDTSSQSMSMPIADRHDAAGDLEKIYEALRAGAVPAGIRVELTQLRQKFAAMRKNAAVEAIRRFLDSKADAPTHLGFKPASNGALDGAPTLRTFLLDELGRLDPAAAADYSKTVLASMDSPDEWAVALRNLAWGDTSADGRALLEQKALQMLQYAPWQQNPSAGFLEAFDVPVYLGGTDLVPALSDLVRSQDNPALAHAAFLALDRLVINNPAAVLESLQAAPDWMTGREATRADYFARADVRDPQQRQVLESYLLNPSLGASELQTFAGAYPNLNFMLSPNLLTQNATVDHDSLLSRDAQSLAVAQQWLADPRFARVAPALQAMIQRLQGFAAQAAGQ